MSNLVIVAIPDENDRVWKVSSEKIPHLTLLFLGDVDAISNSDQITQFVEHAANTTLRRFYLPVDRRGELGEDKADVLFFKKGRYDYKAIRDFRVQLLKDNNIRTAYDSATQFEGPWNPHLTLGYPETPAKADDTDRDFGFYDVAFNKIAVWFGDFEGPEFLLKDYWDEFESLESVPMDVVMSGVTEAELAHYGVKGMRWGVRKVDSSGETFEFDDLDSADSAAQHSMELGAEFLVHAGVMTPDNFLEHYGVKGMQWGVRREDVEKAAGSTTSTVGKVTNDAFKFAKDIQFESRTQRQKDEFGGDARSEADEIVMDTARKPYRDHDLPAIKERHPDAGFKTRLFKPLSKEAKAYRKDARETYVKRLETTANTMKNASGTREYTIREIGGELPTTKYGWEVSTREARHADGGNTFFLDVVMDEDGYITDLKKVSSEDAIAQSMDNGAHFLAGLGVIDETELTHYGVKGMRWGQRKAPPMSVDASGTSRVPHGNKRKTKIEVAGGENHPAHNDAIEVAEARAKLKKSGSAALSNAELQKMARRLQLETQVAQLTSNRGQKFIQRQFEQQGQQAVQVGVRKGGAHVIKKAGKVAATTAVTAALL